MLTLIKNGIVYSPNFLGKKDILLCGGKIECIEDEINLNSDNVAITIIDTEGKFVFPGFIDSHVHLLGGGGEGGFKTRTPEINLTDITTGGVTTVVGCLGTDGITRDIKSLIAKANALEEEGITTYLYTGSYDVPVKTLMGSIKEDIILFDKIIGVGEIALSDHRSSVPTIHEIARIAADARVSGMLSGKAGVVNIHVGDGKEGLQYLMQIAESTEIPLTQFIPTHITRSETLFKMGIEYAKNGGLIDLTTSTSSNDIQNDKLKCSKALKIILQEGVPIENVTFSSDGQGSLPTFNNKSEFIGLGVGKVTSLYEEVRDAILKENIKIEDALKVITINPANNLKLSTKGEIAPDKDADIVIVDQNELKIDTVISKGKIMILEKEVKIKGTFE